MNNLQWLYGEDETFREAVKAAGATYIGSTNLNFANAWLMERHHEEDEACLLGQHADVDTYEERIETQRQTIEFYAEELRKVKEIAEKYREDAIAAQNELENTKRAMNRAAGKWAKADADATEWMHIVACLEDRIAVRDKSIERLERQRDEASAERDAYRDLCGRMRKMANEMLVMEVD